MAHSVVTIMGPTATGKTALSIALALRLQESQPVAIMSCDSQQVYQGIDIGVAKPTMEERQGIRHEGLDLMPPTEACSAGIFAERMKPVLDGWLTEGTLPLVAGGTGFYLNALLYPGAIPETPSDPETRQRWRDYAAEHGAEALYRVLQEHDPRRAEALHPNDLVRITRALEIIELTGEPVPQVEQRPETFVSPYALFHVALAYRDRDRHLAYITERLYEMMAFGFLEEAKGLYERYGTCEGMRHAHGYPEMIQVLEGTMTVDEAVAQTALNIQRYSKRQMTWFKRYPGVRWFYTDEQTVEEIAEMLLPPLISARV